MSDPPAIGFYAHHHGRGHLSRVAAVCEAVGPARCTVATSHPDAAEVLPPGTHLTALPMDIPPRGPVGDFTAGGVLHWVPQDPVTATRAHAITGWLVERAPAVVLVDVSVEVAVLVRLAGVPAVVVRMHGDRSDAAHDLAHRIADSVLAPFPASLEHPSTASWVRDKTTYSGFVAPADVASVADRPAGDGRRVLVVWGQGHPPPTADELDAAATASSPEWSWEMIGPPCPERAPSRVRHRGWVREVAAHVARADVVVGPPGDGLLAQVAGAGARYVAVCEPRPFDEHQRKAECLAAIGGAMALDAWPEPAAWPGVLAEASGLDPAALSGLGTDGARAIADHLCTLAGVPPGEAA